jgi:hypothetical protein
VPLGPHKAESSGVPNGAFLLAYLPPDPPTTSCSTPSELCKPRDAGDVRLILTHSVVGTNGPTVDKGIGETVEQAEGADKGVYVLY